MTLVWSKFLSEEWLEQAAAIRAEYEGKGGAPPHQMRMNLVITDVPEDVSAGPIDAHMDTTSGDVHMDVGHLDNPDLTVTLEYETAKAILVEGNPQAGMQAFMAGKIKVQGDMTKMMALQAGGQDPVAAKVAEGLTRLKQHPLDIVIVDPQYVPAMLFDDKADASDRIVSLIAAAADKAGVNRFRRWALMRHWHIHDNVPLERMIDPTDDARLHQSDWSTRRVSVALCEAISKAPAAVTQG